MAAASQKPASPNTRKDRYGDPGYRRLALAPGILAAIALLAGFALIGGGYFIIIQFAVAILAAICGWFAIQAKQWWWLPLFAAIIVAWNPVVPFAFDGWLWFGAQYAAVIVFALAGWLIKVKVPDEKDRAARR